MKYDITIGNPPYNDGDTVGKREGNLRGNGKKLFRIFMEHALVNTTEHILLVGPCSRSVYGPKQRREWRKEGLYEVKDVLKYFSTVSPLSVVTYTFDKTQQRELDDCTYFEVPKSNLGQVWKGKTGIYRNKYEHLLKDEGKYKVHVTVNKTKYTDDLKLAEAICPRNSDKWNIILNSVNTNMGRVQIVEPGEYFSSATVSLTVANREEAEILKKYLESDEVAEINKRTRRSAANSKYHLSAIPNPLVK